MLILCIYYVLISLNMHKVNRKNSIIFILILYIKCKMMLLEIVFLTSMVLKYDATSIINVYNTFIISRKRVNRSCG